MRRFPAALIWFANAWGSMKSRRCRQPRSTRRGGAVRLTTLLAHSSGEWISSDWPMCPVAETSAPHRMGAALTYARRYALFALVGIAGEDDLDAPDPAEESSPKNEAPRPASEQPTKPHPPNGNGRGRPVTAAGTLPPEASARLRHQMLAELAAIGSSEAITCWAQPNLPAKGDLAAVDTRAVEDGSNPSSRNLANQRARQARPNRLPKPHPRWPGPRRSQIRQLTPHLQESSLGDAGGTFPPKRCGFATRNIAGLWLNNPV